MSKQVFALAAALLTAAPLTAAPPAYANGPTDHGATPEAPRFYQSPTDEYVPPAARGTTPGAPRSYQSPTDEYIPPARQARTIRRAPGDEHGGTPLTALIQSLRREAKPTYSYRRPPTRSRYPNSPAYISRDFDGAPCPSPPSMDLAPLFLCTLR